MAENRRKIRTVAKANWLEEIRRDPIRLVELSLVAFGALVAAVSSLFAWQAASYTAEQAKYAREALDRADSNATFRTYIASWNRLCRAITPLDYKLFVQTPGMLDGALNVVADNAGFDRAAFDIDAYNKRVSEQDAVVRDNLLEFRTFASDDNSFIAPDQGLTIAPYFYIANIPSERPEDIQTQLIRNAALCNYYTEEQMRWYKDREHRIAPVIYLLQNMKIEYIKNTSPDPVHR